MMILKVKDILEVCKAKLIQGNEDLVLNNFSKDSRTINKEDVYIAIRGENFDGNKFFDQVYQKGSNIWILDRIDEILDVNQYNDCTIILVEDTVKCMQTLAQYIRSQINLPIVAVTGSVGKTSTKEMISSVLEQKYKVLKTQGNNNNDIGLPFTMLNLKDEEVIVLEMGMNHLKEISLLSEIAKPTIAVITNVGTAHIGNLGSKENILKAKMEIMDGMEQTGTIIINNDYPLLKDYNEFKVDHILRFSIHNQSDFQATNIINFNNQTSYKLEGNKIEVPIMGDAFVYNSQAAYLVGRELGLTIKEIQTGIKKFKQVGNRMKIETVGQMTIINDTYNANLEAMQSALDYLSKYEGKRKIAVLGDILELDNFSQEIHEQIGELVVENKIDFLYTTGEASIHVVNSAIASGMNSNKIKHLTKEEIGQLLLRDQQEGDIVLFKASNSIKLNDVIENIKKIIRN